MMLIQQKPHQSSSSVITPQLSANDVISRCDKKVAQLDEMCTKILSKDLKASKDPDFEIPQTTKAKKQFTKVGLEFDRAKCLLELAKESVPPSLSEATDVEKELSKVEASLHKTICMFDAAILQNSYEDLHTNLEIKEASVGPVDRTLERKLTQVYVTNLRAMAGYNLNKESYIVDEMKKNTEEMKKQIREIKKLLIEAILKNPLHTNGGSEASKIIQKHYQDIMDANKKEGDKILEEKDQLVSKHGNWVARDTFTTVQERNDFLLRFEIELLQRVNEDIANSFMQSFRKACLSTASIPNQMNIIEACNSIREDYEAFLETYEVIVAPHKKWKVCIEKYKKCTENSTHAKAKKEILISSFNSAAPINHSKLDITFQESDALTQSIQLLEHAATELALSS